MTRAAAAPEQLAAMRNQWSGERSVPASLKAFGVENVEAQIG